MDKRLERDRRTMAYWNSISQICDRVIATIEQRPGFPPELWLSPHQAFAQVMFQLTFVRRILKIQPDTLQKAS